MLSGMLGERLNSIQGKFELSHALQLGGWTVRKALHRILADSTHIPMSCNMALKAA